jgi:dipeptidyl-peptidase-4
MRRPRGLGPAPAHDEEAMSTHMLRCSRLMGALVAVMTTAAPAAAQLPVNVQDVLRRIHTTQEFGGGGRGAGAGGRWVDGGAGYTAAERSPGAAIELVRYDTATGRRDIVVTAAQLTPPSLGKPIQFSDYATSADGRRMLFATDGRPTVIRKTAYEYWVLDRMNGEWRKLGLGAQASAPGLEARLPSVEESRNDGLLYAKLSPDGTRAAYVRGNNLFVEDLRTGAATALTSDGSPMIINGTSDWVY